MRIHYELCVDHNLIQYPCKEKTKQLYKVNTGGSHPYYGHLPGLHYAGYPVDKMEEYPFILGGEILIATDSGGYGQGSVKDATSIYDIKNEKVINHELFPKCLVQWSMRAICMRDSKHDEFSVFVYVHKVHKTKEFKQLKHLPDYMIQLILKWISTELEENSNQHWKINIDDILMNLQRQHMMLL